jgi:hypothetical protein
MLASDGRDVDEWMARNESSSGLAMLATGRRAIPAARCSSGIWTPHGGGADDFQHRGGLDIEAIGAGCADEAGERHDDLALPGGVVLDAEQGEELRIVAGATVDDRLRADDVAGSEDERDRLPRCAMQESRRRPQAGRVVAGTPAGSR